MLEQMSAFFEKRLAGYDEHMLTEIEGADEFYAYTASLLPTEPDSRVLDLGCGTGHELEAYLSIQPRAKITGIDLSRAMLDRLASKFEGKDIRLVCASYFDTPFENGAYAAAVSVESLHHFERERKLGLYARLYDALKPAGYFVLTDYFAESPELETEYFRNLAELKRAQGITDDAFYHYDTPLTVDHETQILREAGFKGVDIRNNWGATYTLVARK